MNIIVKLACKTSEITDVAEILSKRKNQPVSAIKGAIVDLINQCVPEPAECKSKTRTKRAMSGWNCYLKKCRAGGKLSFQECMQDKGRKEKEYTHKKEEWKNKAAQGCPI